MDPWTPRVVENPEPAAFARATDRLLTQQAEAWPLLGEGLLGLRQARTKTVAVGDANVAVRHIPHRLRSTTAKVDAASIAARPCFLCAAHLPPAQRGIGFGTDYVALANPFPILERHLTIVHRAHTPQRLAGRTGDLLALAQALPGSFVIYNGPECGASAPDHLHFQAGDRALFPIAAVTPRADGTVLLDEPVRALVIQGPDRGRVQAALDAVVRAFAEITAHEPEPRLNLAALHADDGFHVYVFPRSKHRPDVFARGDLLVSPAAIDLCGILVAPREEDFDRLTAAAVRAIYDEVVLPRAALTQAAAAR